MVNKNIDCPGHCRYGYDYNGIRQDAALDSYRGRNGYGNWQSDSGLTNDTV